jgi:hypothetical protein
VTVRPGSSTEHWDTSGPPAVLDAAPPTEFLEGEGVERVALVGVTERQQDGQPVAAREHREGLSRGDRPVGAHLRRVGHYITGREPGPHIGF